MDDKEKTKRQTTMSTFPKEMKPVGFTVKRREGDWMVTYEVVGYNERSGCNVWAEKKRQWSPRPSLVDAIAAIDRERGYQVTKLLHRRINA
jgi:hypothetical protein